MSGDLILLFSCSTALSLLGGYAFWIPIRVLRLKADQIEIFVKARKLVFQMGCQHDPAYLKFQEQMDKLIRSASTWSLPVLIFVSLKISAREVSDHSEVPDFFSENAKLTALLQHASNESWAREIRFVFQETLSGWVALLPLWTMARLSRDELRRGMEALIHPGDILQSV